jgi:hypothetical protein
MIILISPYDNVELTPMVKLEDWSIQEIQTAHGEAYYFCGRINGRGRISTRIVEWFPQNKIGKTESGRIYQLTDAPGDPKNSELEIIKLALRVKYLAITYRDVTFEFTNKRH